MKVAAVPDIIRSILPDPSSHLQPAANQRCWTSQQCHTGLETPLRRLLNAAGRSIYWFCRRHRRVRRVTTRYAPPAIRMITGPLGKFDG